jgi:HK97 family phage prohead protease
MNAMEIFGPVDSQTLKVLERRGFTPKSPDELLREARAQARVRPAVPFKLIGIAAPFREMSTIIWGEPESPFREWIAPGAFARSIERDEITFFRAHDDGPWASTSNGALKLVDDPKDGLRFELSPPMEMVGDVLLDWVRMNAFSGMSFRFVIDDCEWRSQGTERIRVIRQASLRHIAAVPKPRRPAYPGTSIRIQCADWHAEAENRRLELELAERDSSR